MGMDIQTANGNGYSDKEHVDDENKPGLMVYIQWRATIISSYTSTIQYQNVSHECVNCWR